jgi:DNA-binding PadR family transcriptional regulator
MAARPTELRHPLSLPVLHILLALADGPRHGYAIKKAVEDRSDGAVRLGPGTLYEAIQRLEHSEYIEEAERAAGEPPNGQLAQRRYYKLTPRGWSVLRTEVRQLAHFVDRARSHARLQRPDPA